jgi:hypothetical protein
MVTRELGERVEVPSTSDSGPGSYNEPERKQEDNGR